MLAIEALRERFERELAMVELPAMSLIERHPATPAAIPDIEEAVSIALRDVVVPQGGSVAIGVGSRGIAEIVTVVAAVVREIRARGAAPFIVPAMGSHGASTVQGQVEVLAHLGVTEMSVGASIRATMETEVVATLPNGVPVHVDALAMRADAIVPVNRIKPHTSFRAEHESGIAKMLAVGFGKQHGARAIHSLGWGEMSRNVPDAAKAVIATGKVAFGVAIIENANEAPCRIAALPDHAILECEPALLKEAMANLSRLPLNQIDVLIVDRVGKNISGGGADPNVTGRYPTEYISGGPKVTRLVYLAFTDEADGNGNGVGLADVISADLARRYDPLATYLNALTTTAAGNARLPMVMPTKELAVKAALRMCPDLRPHDAVIVRIADTLRLNRMWLSSAAMRLLTEPITTLAQQQSFSLDAAYGTE